MVLDLNQESQAPYSSSVIKSDNLTRFQNFWIETTRLAEAMPMQCNAMKVKYKLNVSFRLSYDGDEL
jgi:lipocalin